MVFRLFSLFSVLLLWISQAQAWSSTVYTKDAIYIQLSDGTLLQYNLSNVGNSKKLSTSDISSNMATMASPPANASLTEGPNGLLAISNSSYSSTCGKTPLSIYEYDQKSDSWTTIATSDPTSDGVYHLESASAWSVKSGEMIYIYGGQCNNKAYSSLFAYNTTSKEFSQPDAGTSPAALYGASVAKVSNNTSVLVGGRSNAGWIGMNQLALWQTSSWTFITATNYSDIDSRTNSLIVPSSWNSSTVDADDDVSLLVIGGKVSGRESTPYIGNLQASAEGWKWSAAMDSSDASQQVADGIIGAFTLYDALILLSSSDDGLSSRDLSSSLKINMFNSKDSFSSLSSLEVPTVSSASVSATTATETATATQTATKTAQATTTETAKNSHSSSSGLSTGGIAALSTVLPLFLIAVLAVVGVFFWRRRRRQFVPYSSKSPASSVRGFGEYFEDPNPNPWYSPADGDEKSINSWNEKRAQYEQQLQQHQQQHQRGQSYYSVESTDSQNQLPSVVYDPYPVHDRSGPGAAALTPISAQRPAGFVRPQSAMMQRSPQEVVQPLRSSYSLSSHRSPFADPIPVSMGEQQEEDYYQDDNNKNNNKGRRVSSRRRTRLVIANPDEQQDVDSDSPQMSHQFQHSQNAQEHQDHHQDQEHHLNSLVPVHTNISEVSKSSESSGGSVDSSSALLPQDNSSSSSIDKNVGQGIHRRTRSDLTGTTLTGDQAGTKPRSRVISGSLRYH